MPTTRLVVKEKRETGNIKNPCLLAVGNYNIDSKEYDEGVKKPCGIEHDRRLRIMHEGFLQDLFPITNDGGKIHNLS